MGFFRRKNNGRKKSTPGGGLFLLDLADQTPGANIGPWATNTGGKERCWRYLSYSLYTALFLGFFGRADADDECVAAVLFSKKHWWEYSFKYGVLCENCSPAN
jgi:hypothetical protein